MLNKITLLINTTVFALNVRSVAFQIQGMVQKQEENCIRLVRLPVCLQGFPVPLYVLKRCRSGNTKKKSQQCFLLHTKSAPEMRKVKKNSSMITGICDLLNKSLNVQLSLTEQDQRTLNLMLPVLQLPPISKVEIHLCIMTLRQ